MATSEDTFSQSFSRNLRLSSPGVRADDDPSFLVRSASAPPTHNEDSVNFLYSNKSKPIEQQTYPTYMPSPNLGPVNTMGGYYQMGGVPASPHLFAHQDPTNSPYAGSMNSFSQPYDYFQMMNNGVAHQPSPVLNPSPYSHPLLPQSLLGASGIGTPPDGNSKSFYRQQYSPVLGPDYYGNQYYGMQQPPAMHIPMMQQLPPAASSSTDAPISRYLRDATSGQHDKKSLSLETEWSSVVDNSKKNDDADRASKSGSVLLEELRSKMKHSSPTNTRSHRNQNDYQNNSYYAGVAGKSKSPSNGSSSGVSWGIGAIRGQVCDFAKDQHGSRFIQQQLESPSVSHEDKQQLFDEVLPFARMLCTDVFGNYVIQKLLDPNVGTPSQQEQLCETAIKGNVLELSMHMYGCRVVQKLVEKVFGEEGNDARVKYQQPQLRGSAGSKLHDPDFQDALLEELSPHIVKCVQDQNGNHVVQKCIEQIRPISRIYFILDAFKGNICLMARHPYGCRVVQRVLENCEEDRVSSSLSELIAQIQSLVQDQYGNYVIQHIIEGSRDRHPLERKRLIRAVQDNVLPFSMHKFASNVVEKCLQYGDSVERREIIGRMLEVPTDSRKGCPLQQMMKDPYANYVVQKVMDMAEPDQRELVVVLVKENAPALKRLTYGKHILARLDKIGNDHHHRGKRQGNTHHTYF